MFPARKCEERDKTNPCRNLVEMPGSGRGFYVVGNGVPCALCCESFRRQCGLLGAL